MALSGLVLVILSVALPAYFIKKLKFQLFEIRRDVDIAKLRSERLKNKSQAIQNGIEKQKLEILERIERVINSEESADIEEHEVEDLGATISEIDKELFDEKVRKISTKCDVKKVGYLSEQLKSLVVSKILGLWIGLILAISGFSLWYARLQVYVDNAVKVEYSIPNQLLEPTLNFPRFNGHLHQTSDEVSDGKIQSTKKDLAILK